MAEGGHICLIVAGLLAAIGNLPKANGQTNQIINYVYSNNGLGAYSFEFKTSDGTYRKEDGGFINSAGKSTLSIRGEYGYFNPTGQYYSVRYIADANGFQPKIDDDGLMMFAVIAAASAAPQNPQDVQIVRYESDNAGLNSYSFAWELSDGSKHEEQGQLKNQGTDNEALAVQGQYGWVGPDGVSYIITYIADENGFQPQIQQGPGGAIPSAVVASLLG
ncbi:unnamed protein product, partial [Iphiclides podalirius]